MNNRNELYLVVLSILLGITVLKLTEIFQLGDQLQELFNKLKIKTPGVSVPLSEFITILGIYFFIGGYLIFFTLMALASYGIVKQIGNSSESAKHPDLGPIVGMCIAVLSVTYVIAVSVVLYKLNP